MLSFVRCTFVCVSVYLCLVVTCFERAYLLALVCGVSLHPYLLLMTIQYWFWYGSDNFSAQYIKIISCYKKIGYIIIVYTACLVVKLITVGNFALLFYCMPVGRTSDSMTVPT